MFDKVAGNSGLALSVPKTKLLVAGTGLTSDDLAPLELDEGVVDVVDQLNIWDHLWRLVVAWLLKLAIELHRHLGRLAVSVILCLLLQT